LTESLRQTGHPLKRQHHPRCDDGACNVAAAGSIIEALRNVALGIQLFAFRRNMAEQGARVGELS
jgi:hypothetical protein